MKRIGVLVTGVGAPGGVTIMKALRHSKLPLRLVTSDLNPFAVGLYFSEAAYRLPKVADDRYLPMLVDLCRSEKIDVAFVGAEPEIRFLLPHLESLEGQLDTKFVLSRPELMSACMDKYATAKLLTGHGFRCPETVLGTDDDGVEDLVRRRGFPLFIKPRFGSGSQYSFKIKETEELEFFRHWVPGAVVQEFLSEGDQEYTVGVYVDRTGRVVGSIASRRDLAAGLTYRAFFEEYPDLIEHCERVAERLKPLGPCNFQLRRDDDEWVIFEINPRCSSSTVMRALLGFNEPEMAIRDLVLEETLTRPVPRSAVSLRFWEEAYVEGASGLDQADFGRLELPQGWIEHDLMVRGDDSNE